MNLTPIIRQSEGMESSITKKRLDRYDQLKVNQRDRYDYELIKKNDIRGQDEIQTDFTFSKETGPICHILNRPFPMRGYFGAEQVMGSAKFKRAIPQFVEKFRSANFFVKIAMLISLKQYSKIYFYIAYRSLVDYMIDPEYYTPPIKEIRRALEGLLSEYGREVLCFYAESDCAYRYRYQDFLGELNKENLKKNPTKEIKRLVGILYQRELAKEKELYGLIKKVLPFLLLVPSIKKKIITFLERLDVDKVKLSEEDIFWTNRYVDYDFRGLTKEERQKENLDKYNQKQYIY